MRMLLYIVITMLMCTLARGQQQIPNGGLEDWTLVPGSGTFKDYEEPNDGWTSGNGVIHVAPGTDPVCEKTTNWSVLAGGYLGWMVQTKSNATGVGTVGIRPKVVTRNLEFADRMQGFDVGLQLGGQV